MRRSKPLVAITFALSFGLVAPGPGLAASPAAHDIAQTSRGQQLAADAAARFESYGVPTSGADMAVLEFPDGGILIAPSSLASTVVVSSQVANGHLDYSAFVDVGVNLASDSGEAVASGSESVLAASYWSLRESYCFASMYVNDARFDVCYRISKLINDGSGTKDYWGLEQFGTAFESGKGLNTAWVSGQRRSGSNTQSWERWSPTANLQKNCVTTFIGVTHIVTLGANYEVCEKWTITKSANGTSPYFKSSWNCNFFICSIAFDNRDVAYTIETSLSQGLTPLYTLGYGMTA